MAATMRAPTATPRMAPPPLPSLQTSSTGLRTSTSPSLASKRPPSIPRQLSSVGPHNASAGGHSGRPVRNRKESTRQSSARSMSRALNEGIDSASVKNSIPVPYVRSDEYILKKFRNCPPSLILHLHSTYFRFDQQDGTFQYNSPMKFILEHIRAKTIPHEMMEELDKGPVRYYEGCLIVEIQDHKSSTSSSSSQLSKDKSSLPSDKSYSVHKPSDYLTPSPYVPYPSPATTPRLNTSPTHSTGANSTANTVPTGPRKFTTVLHPTSLSRHAEILIEVTTPMPELRSHNKRNQTQAARDAVTPSSAYPPTPLSAVMNLPAAPKGNPAKRRKMRLEEEDIYEFEADVLRNTEPLLLLDPAESFEDCRAIMQSLTHPQHNHNPPKRAGRKRTFAELAADEAQAAEEERLALVGDIRLQPSLGVTAAGQSTAIDGGDAAKQCESNFRWIKDIEDIKQKHAEDDARKAQEEGQKKLEESQRNRERLAEEEREVARERERLKREQAEKQRQAQIQAATAQAHAQAQAQAVAPSQTPHLSTSNLVQQHLINKMFANQQQHMQQQQVHGQAQAQHASPMTGRASMNSSPITAHPMHQQQQHQMGMPMGFQMQTNHAVNSPRPGSAMKMHPGMAQPMARQVSQQQSHTSQSRTGTPHMATPQMANSMPAHNNMSTPQRQQQQQQMQQQMQQGSPPMAMMGGQMNMNVNQLPQQSQNMEPAARQQYNMMLQKRREMQQRQVLAQLQQGSPAQNGIQMSPQQLAQFQAHQAQQQQANHNQNLANGMANGTANRPPISQADYRQQLSQQQTIARNRLAQQQTQVRQAAMNGVSSGTGFPNSMAMAQNNMSRQPSQQQPFPQQPNQPLHTPNTLQRQQGQTQQQDRPQGSPQHPNINSQRAAQQQMQYLQNQKAIYMAQAAKSNGGIIPPDAEHNFSRWFEAKRREAMLKQQQAQQAQQQAAAMSRVPQQHPNSNQNQHQQQQQDMVQQGFGGMQMNPQQQAALMRQMQQQGISGGMQQNEYVAQLMRQKEAVQRQRQQAQAQQMGMNGIAVNGMANVNGGHPMGMMPQQGMPMGGMNGMPRGQQQGRGGG